MSGRNEDMRGRWTWGIYWLRLGAAMPMVVVGGYMEDFGRWLCDQSHRVEGEEPS